MRSAVVLAFVLAGCVQQNDPPPPTYYPPPPPDYPPPPGPPTTYGCQSDASCTTTGYVCARTGDCLPASDVRTIHVVWTLQTAVASTTSCANSPDLEIQFSGSNTVAGYPWGYAPLPCVEGKFSIDKFPTYYTYVQLGRDGNVTGGTGGAIDATTNTATLDLPF